MEDISLDERLARNALTYLHIQSKHIPDSCKIKPSIFEPPPLKKEFEGCEKKVRRSMEVSVNRFDYCGPDFCKVYALSNGLPEGNQFVGLTIITKNKVLIGYDSYLKELESVEGVNIEEKLTLQVVPDKLEDNEFHANILYNRPRIAGETDAHFKMLSKKLVGLSRTYFDTSNEQKWNGKAIP